MKFEDPDFGENPPPAVVDQLRLARYRSRTRIGNLILASFALLIFVMAESGCHSALSSSPPRLHHDPVTAREIVMDSIVLFWFAGAVGLSSRRRLAWIGSLLGVGASACFFAVALVGLVGLYMFPNEEMHRLRYISGTASGYLAGLVIGVVEFSVVLALLLAVFIGLLKMRKDLK